MHVPFCFLHPAYTRDSSLPSEHSATPLQAMEWDLFPLFVICTQLDASYFELGRLRTHELSSHRNSLLSLQSQCLINIQLSNILSTLYYICHVQINNSRNGTLLAIILASTCFIWVISTIIYSVTSEVYRNASSIDWAWKLSLRAQCNYEIDFIYTNLLMELLK